MASATRIKNARSQKRRVDTVEDRSPKIQANGAANRLTVDRDRMIKLAESTFHQELPVLLRRRKSRGQWVAYAGARRLGFAATKHKLLKKCVQQGAEPGQLYLRCVAPLESAEAEVLLDE